MLGIWQLLANVFASDAAKTMNRTESDVDRSWLIDRDREFGAVEAWLHRPRGSTVVFVHGERGIGKTSLWRRAIEVATDRRYRVLACRPAEAEAGMRFAGLGDIMGDVWDDELAALAPSQRRALQVATLESAQAGEAVDIREVSLGLMALLRHVSTQRPVMVAVDDTQWLDRASAAVLQFVFRRLNVEPVLGLATYDTGLFGLERQPTPPVEDVEGRLVSILLPPLPDEHMSRLLHSRRRHGWSRSLVREAIRIAAGNPRMALELTPAPAGGNQDEPFTLPEAITRWLDERLAGLSPAARETLWTAACLEDPSPDLLVRVLGTPAVEALDEASTAGIVKAAGARLEFPRPAVKSALRQSVDADHRRLLNGRLAHSVSDPGERLRHLALATQDADEELAVALEQAARDLSAQGHAERACTLAELAVRLTVPGDRGTFARRRLLAAETRVTLGDDAIAAEGFAEVAEAMQAGEPDRGRVLRRLAWLELNTRGVDASQRRLEQSFPASAADTSLLASIACDLSFLHYLRGDLTGASAHGARAMELAAPIDLDRKARLLAAAADAAAGTSPWPQAHALDQLREGATVSREEWPSIDVAVRGLVNADDLSIVRPALRDLAREAKGGASWLGWQAEAECWRELWGEATSLADRGIQLALETGEWVATARLRYVRALVAAYRGWLAEARAEAAEGADVAERAGLRTLAALNRAVLGHIELVRRSGRAAVEWFEGMLTGPLPGTEPGLLRLFPDAIEALIDAGDVDMAAEQLTRLDACQARLRVRWLAASCARCRGAVSAARGELDEAERWLERAIQAELVAPRRLELGRHLLAAGVVGRRRKRREHAAEAIERATNIFVGLGAERWRERAAEERRRLGRGRPLVEHVLTATQQQVADLVAQGKSNKEVAQMLSLSVYTVESNLKVIFRKLGVQSRTALAFRLSRERSGQQEDDAP
jgi:DNA-binding CsgD family transcriptional regulator